MNKVSQFVLRLQLKSNTSTRTDCPTCGGTNTFSVSNINGKIKYYCFKNSCGIKGNNSASMSMDDIKAKVEDVQPKPLFLKDCAGWTQEFMSIPKVVEYLEHNNCIEAYNANPDRFFYDRIRDRIVFVEYDTINSFKLATGRSLNGANPKWYKYVALPGEYFQFQAIRGPVGLPTVVVEDCASACSIGCIANSLALCGTNYNLYSLVNKLSNVRDVIICLDADAQLKSLKLQRDLLGAGKFKSVKVVSLPDDAKYLGERQLKILLYGE